VGNGEAEGNLKFEIDDFKFEYLSARTSQLREDLSMHDRRTFLAVAIIMLLPLSAGTQSASPSAPASAAQASSQTSSQTTSAAAQAKGMMMLTIFLKHDQSKTLDEINEHLKKTGFNEKFPPPDTEVVSWYVMMGVGQVVTLRFPAEKLRDVNLAIEHGAWGGYRTEFYPTYDYMPVWKAQRQAGK
jgi:hypothetical protein